jgi:hypothetical protein
MKEICGRLFCLAFLSVTVFPWLFPGNAIAAVEPPPPAVEKLIVPESGAYTGAYIDFGEGEDNVTLEALEKFETLVGKHQAIIAFGNFWGEGEFAAKEAEIVSRYGAIPLIFWSPWDRPYEEHKLPDACNLYSILSGTWDAYIDKWAESVKNFGKPVLVAWGIEMNGMWFPWSGYYYGGGQRNPDKEDKAPAIGPELFKQAYRYVVDRVREKGARNIQWVLHLNNASWPDEEWNSFAAYYPGPDYVDWLGLSVYGKTDKAWSWASFSDVFDSAYQKIGKIDPGKPLMVAEWGVGEYPNEGDKAEWFTKAFSDLQNRYPQIKAAVYWHERWQNPDESYSNLRVNSSPEALEAYREGVKAPYWIDSPRFQTKP